MMKTRILALAMVSACALAAGLPALTVAAHAQPTAGADAAATHIHRLSPALDKVIAPGAKIERVATGFDFVEGPMWRGSAIWFSDLVGNKMYKIGPDGKAVVLIDKAGGLDNPPKGAFAGSNAMVTDKDGSVLMNQHGMRRIVRLDDQMHMTPFIDRYDGKRLNSPNDLVFAKDGSLWITDPPYGLAGQDKDPAKEVPFNAVWRYKDGKLTPALTTLPRPNGIGFSPDGKYLYLSNSEPEMYVVRYDVTASDALKNPHRMITYHEVGGKMPVDVPDGLKVDSAGNLWSSGPGGIRIISPAGKVLGQIVLPEPAAANVAWGGPDWKTAYIMSSSSVYKVQMNIPGEVPLYHR
jgi:gluconolactonase